MRKDGKVRAFAVIKRNHSPLSGGGWFTLPDRAVIYASLYQAQNQVMNKPGIGENRRRAFKSPKRLWAFSVLYMEV